MEADISILRKTGHFYFALTTQPLGLRPELRNITQILGIGRDLLEQAPGRLHGSQILLALIFLSAFANQSVLAPDALDSQVRNGQIELSFQTSRSQGGQLATQSQDVLFHLRRGFVWAMLMSTTVFAQPGRPVLLKATQPFPYRGHGRGEGPCGRFDPVLTGELH